MVAILERSPLRLPISESVISSLSCLGIHHSSFLKLSLDRATCGALKVAPTPSAAKPAGGGILTMKQGVPPSHHTHAHENEQLRPRGATENAPVSNWRKEARFAVDTFFAQKESLIDADSTALRESVPPKGAEAADKRRRGKKGHGSMQYSHRPGSARTPEMLAKWERKATEVASVLREARGPEAVAAALGPLTNNMGRNVLNRTIHKLAAAGNLDTALHVYEWMKTQREDFRPNAATFAQAIRAAAHANKPGKAVGIFEEMEAAGLSPDLYVFSALVTGYARAGMYKQALELLDRMRERGVRPDLVVYTTVFNACVKGGLRVGRILELYGEMRQDGLLPDLFLCTLLLQSCANGGLVTEAEQLFTEMQEAGIAPDVRACNVMLDVYGRAGMVDQAEALVVDMKAMGLRPNNFSYTALIVGCGKVRLYRKAEAAFRELLAGGEQPDAVLVSAMMTVYGNANQLRRAEDMFKQMEDAGFLPDLIAYNSLLDAFGKARMLDDMERVYHRLRHAGLRPDLYTYTSLITNYRQQQRFEEAVAVYREMQSAGCSPSRLLYNGIRFCLEKAGEVEEALALGQRKAGPRANMPTNDVSQAIEKLGRQGRWEDALTLFAEERGEREVPPMVWTKLMEVCARSGRHEEAREALSGMKEAGLVPDVWAYTAVIEAHRASECVGVAEGVYREMEDDGVAPNVACFNSLLRVYGAAGKVQEAEAVFDRMRVLGFIPNRFTYSALMKALLEGKQYRRVLSLGMEMRELNIETNVVIKKLIDEAESGLADVAREHLQLATQT